MRDLDENVNVEVVEEVKPEVDYEGILQGLKLVGCYALMGFVCFKWGYFRGKKDAMEAFEYAIGELAKEAGRRQ